MTKLIFAFRNFENAANKFESMKNKLTVAYLKHYPIICPEKLKKKHEELVSDASMEPTLLHVQILQKHLPRVTEENY